MRLPKVSIDKLIKVANGLTNPKQAIDVLLSAMDKKNPGAANTIRKMMRSGKNPAEALKESAAQGTINLEQLKELKATYKIARNMGLKMNVPNNVWNEAEAAIRSINSTDNGFTGF